MRWLKVFCLNVYYISFILSLTLVNTDLTASATLYIFVVRFLMGPHGLWKWSLNSRRTKHSQQFLTHVIRYPNYNKIYHCLTLAVKCFAWLLRAIYIKIYFSHVGRIVLMKRDYQTHELFWRWAMLKWTFSISGFRSWTDPFVKLILCYYHVKLFYRVEVLRVYCSVNYILGREQVDATHTIHNTLLRMSSASFWCSVCVFSVILALATAAPPDRTKGKFS